MIEVVVGRVGEPHGLRGEVTVELRTDEPERRFGGLLIAEAPRGTRSTLTVERTHWHRRPAGPLRGPGRPHRRRGAARHHAVADVDPDESPEDPEEFYDHQLVGLRRRRTPTVTRSGAVTGVLHLPAQDVLVRPYDDGRQVLVPFVAALVPDRRPRRRPVVVDPPAGPA